MKVGVQLHELLSGPYSQLRTLLLFSVLPRPLQPEISRGVLGSDYLYTI